MPCEFLLGRIPNGVVVRLVGRGTMFESAAFRDAAKCLLQDGELVFDASFCEYLDSTFLGCLIGLKKSCEPLSERRFSIAASPAARVRLFCTSCLDKYFDFVDDCPEILGQWTPVDVGKTEPDELGPHVMHCHERLAEMGGREAAAFKAIADRLAKELGNRAIVD